MEEYDIIKTKIFRSNNDFILQREKRILEAIEFESGTIEKPKKHLISILPNGRKTGDGSLFANPQLPLTKNTFIRMVFIPGKQ